MYQMWVYLFILFVVLGMYVDVSPRTKYTLYMLFGRSQKGNCNAQVVYAIVKRRGGRSLDFRFYDANLHNLEHLGPPGAFSTMLWSSVRTPIVTIIQWWSDEIKLCQQERSNVVSWSLWYLLYVAYTTQQQHQPPSPSSAPPPLAVDEEQVWLTNLYEVNICVYVFLHISANG